jgi:DNA-binding NarL/FixJ family response regulator
MMDQSTIKLLIVTDTPDSLVSLREMLAESPGIDVVGSAETAEVAVSLADIHQPDVVVMDYDMPGLDGAETTRSILHQDASVQVIMLSVVNDADDIRTAMRAGARDYLIKPLAEGELVKTINWLIGERREYARMQAFVNQLRKAYEALFRDDKPVPPTVVAYLESQVEQAPDDRLALETLAVAYARNRDWARLAPIVNALVD